MRKAKTMFEMFTDHARRVVVLAQEEARAHNHDYIGTEHILLGLVREEEGIVVRVFESMDVSAEDIRHQVEELVGSGAQPLSGHIPFNSRAKKAMEFALREVQRLDHSHIGGEHLLLGLIREHDGAGGQVVAQLGLDHDRVEQRIAELRSEGGGREGSEGSEGQA